MDGWQTWRAAMQTALYGERGFYRGSSVPMRHFRTAAHVSPQWPNALLALCQRVDAAVGEPPDFTVVDVGAGGGELLAGLAATAPARWRLLGVDVAQRPVDLPERVTWATQLPVGISGVLLAVEWLDVVPVEVVEQTDEGPRSVLVGPDGTEQLGDPPATADRQWLDRWWPLAEPGDRAEVGRSRDEAWAAAVGRLDRGVAVAVDYAVVPARDLAGTLTGYRDGRQVPPVPDGSMDLTAHVLVESCAAAVAPAKSVLLTQRDALRDLGVSAGRPSYDGDPQDYVRALSATGDAAELLDPGGLGGFTWLVVAKDVPLPLGV